jgi:pimeloyl-ACP methyl ester carboxylesterase
MITRTIEVGRTPLQYHVQEWNADGMPCVMVHGFGDASCVWSTLAHRLSSMRTIAIDLRGHGNSDWDAMQDYDAHTLTCDLAEIIDELCVSRVILIGHSFGGEIALRYAGVSDRVGALVLVDHGPELSKEGIDRVFQDLNEVPREFTSIRDYAGWLELRRPLARPDLIEQFATYNLRRIAPGKFAVKSDPALCRRREAERISSNGRYYRPELWSALARLTCPLLVIRGMASAVLPTDVAQRMVELSGSPARLCIIPRAGHAIMLDNPDGLAGAVGQFLVANSLA